MKVTPMPYAHLLSQHDAERRIRELYASGYRVRDLASLFHVHPLVVARIVAADARKAANA